MEGARADGVRQNEPRPDLTKVKALRDYRRVRGLYFKCSERWGQDHVCPMSVQLHMVEELLELFGINIVCGDDGSGQTEIAKESVCAISRTALSGGVSAKAF